MLNLQIKAGIGGDDSKLLVSELSSIYLKAAKVHNFEVINMTETNSSTDIYL